MSRKGSLFLFLILMLLALPVISYAQSANDGFNPNANNTVNSIAVQADGKILIGGTFTTIGGVTRNCIARLKPDGNLDAAFNPNTDGEVYRIVVQADGKILVGGVFKNVGGMARNCIARLNSNGSLDTGFNPNANYGVSSIVIQADGKILIAGYFATVGGVARSGIARLNPDGTVDTTFNPNVNSYVNSIAIQADGKILVGGQFTAIGGVAIKYIARLNANGSVDTTFNPNADKIVYSIAVQADGKILVGGSFTTIGGGAKNGIARLNQNGSLDTTFNPINANVYSIALQADGKILIGAAFVTTTPDGRGSRVRYGIARLNLDGSRDAGFNPGGFSAVPSGRAQSIAVQGDGKVLIGGGFTTIGGVTRNNIARLNIDGSLDADLNTNASNWVESIVIQPDGKILIGGMFTTIGGVARSFARLNPDRSIDASFDPNPNGPVHFIAVQADGKILIGGGFAKIGGTWTSNAVRLNPDGSLETTFKPDTNSSVWSIAVQADGKILIGGSFSIINGVGIIAIARLNPNGSLDTTFNPNVSGVTYQTDVQSVALQADGKILIGGRFTGAGGVARNGITRLNPDGSLDTTFNPSLNLSESSPFVYSVAVQADGKILVGADFAAIVGGTRKCIARLNPDGSLDTAFNPNILGLVVTSIALQADGKILVGGQFSIGNQYSIARLNPNGSLDTTFNPSLNLSGSSPFVTSIALQADGKILVGGMFTSVGGVARNNIARLTNTDAALQELKVSPTGDTVTWLRGGASPEVWRVTFEHSSDGITWSSLGNGTRIASGSRRTLPGIPGSGIGIAGGWQLTGLSLPFNQNHYVRARGYAIGGKHNGSSSLFESVRMFYNPVPTGPDLIETGVSNPPASATAGSSFSVTDTVKNQGNASATIASITSYYLSLDTSRGSGDVKLTGNRSVPSLGVNGTNSGNVTVTIPSNTPSGSYYLLACADDTQVVAEGNETNNYIASASKINVTAVAPDLIETAVGNPPWSATAGSSLYVWDTVKNQGNASAATSVTRYYLSLDTTKGSGDILLTGNRSVPALGVNGTNTGSVTVTIPSNTPSGSYYLLACADDTQVVAEGNETYNCIASTSRVNVTGVGVSGSSVPASPSGVVAPQPPALVSPSGTITTRTPTYTWNAVGNAAAYQLAVNDSTGVRIRQWYSAEACGCGSGTGTCSVTPAISLNLGFAYWWVQTSNPKGSSPWSAMKFFTIQNP